VDGIVPWDGQPRHAVGHHNVLALPDDAKAKFLEYANRLFGDIRNLWHC